MNALKEKVSERLSRLFADSPSSPSSPCSPPSSLDHAQQNQARSLYKGGTTLTSLLSFIIPSASSDGFGSNKPQFDLKPINPHPIIRMEDGAESQYKFDNFDYYTPSCKNIETPAFKEEEEDKDGSPASNGRSTSASSEGFEEAPEARGEPETPEKPQITEKPMSNLTDDSAFISPELYEFLQSSIPNIVKGCQWVLLYSTLRHGISLRTLIRKSADLPGPCLLIVGDKQGNVFGGLLEAPLNPTAKRKYQGTIQTFVFTTIYGQPRLFRPTGANRYFYMCLNDLLAFGGGENFALCLDGDLLHGTSGPCDTFGNLCLAHQPEFELKNVELWGFTHSSQYQFLT